jgi:superfamily II DNA or RNA helicase
MIEIRLHREIKIEKARLKEVGIYDEFIDYIEKDLFIVNQNWFIRKKMGKSVWKIPKAFKLYRNLKNDLVLPRAYLKKTQDFFASCKADFRTTEDLTLHDDITFERRYTLRPFQARAVKRMLDYREGVLAAPPGAGKTVMGLDIICSRRQPALIIVHRKELMLQWLDRINSFLNIPSDQCGLIGGGASKKSFLKSSRYQLQGIGPKITVAMIQSLSKLTPKELENRFGTVIMDECHHIPAKTFLKAVKKLSPSFIYGLTATPQRKMGDEKIIYLNIGAIRALVSKKSSAEKKISLEFPISDFYAPFDHNSEHQEKLLKKVICNDERNRMISSIALKEIKAGRKTLIITERKDHISFLRQSMKRCLALGYTRLDSSPVNENEFTEKQFRAITLSGDDKGPDRERKLKRLTQGDFELVIATGQLIGEGVDLPDIQTLILAFPFSFEGKMVQYAGRLMRGRGEKRLFDIRDRRCTYLELLFSRRIKGLKKLNFI